MSTYDLPFIPFNDGVNLDSNTISLNATHPANKMLEYDVHNLYGKMQAAATKGVLTSAESPVKDKRPFIMSTGTFAGSGESSGHIIGPNERTWDDLKNATAQIMNMNMFGVPFSGADVCGTSGDSDQDELCARWMQVATFYPFARQFDEDGGNEPYSMSDESYKTMA